MEHSKWIDRFSQFAAKFGNQIHLKSLRDAFATIMPFYILAGLAVLLNNTVFTWIFSGDTLQAIQKWGIVIANGTLSISGLLIAAVTGYFLARNRQFENPLVCALLSVASLVVMMPLSVSLLPLGGEQPVEVGGVLSFQHLGTGAMFAGILIGLVVTELFLKISAVKKLQVQLGDNVPPAVGKSFNVLLPILISVSLVAVFATVLQVAFHTNLIDLITTFIQEPLRHVGTGLVGTMILYTLGNLLWFFGIHQSVIYSSILEPLLIVNITENIAAYAAGQPIPNIINVSQVQTFALMGGSGSTLCLLLATFLVSRNRASRNVAKLALAPGIFNINEPVIFGYPIVYNLSLIIPFILTPTLGIFISYFATSLGWMSPAVTMVPWTTPILANAYLATGGDVRAILVQLVIFAIGTALYLPFVKVNDRAMEQSMKWEEEEA